MVERTFEPRPPFTAPPTVARIAEIGPRTRPRLQPGATAQALGWRELATVAALSLVLGFAQGARTAISPRHAIPAGPPVSAAPPASGSLELDAIRGPLWRPVGSIARRPRAALRPVLWRPAGSDVELSGPLGERTLTRN